MKIWIIDDHPLVGSALEILLAREFPQSEIVSMPARVEEILEKVSDCQNVDVAIVDLNIFGEMGGYRLIKAFQAERKDLPIVVLSMHKERVYVEKALRLGAKAYIVKSDSPDEISRGIKHAILGEKYLSPSALLSEEEAENSVSGQLSAREQEIAQLVMEGLTSKEIADRLKISARTVESHRQSIMKKVGVANTAQLLKALQV